MDKLSKDAETILCFAYKLYLQRRENGMSKREARCFNCDFYKSDSKLSRWQQDDVISSLAELRNNDYIKLYTRGSFQFLDKALVDMENRFKNGAKEVLEFLTNFIP